MDQRGKY